MRQGAIGLREVTFQSITHMAPAAAVAFSIVGGIAFGGGATPLAVVVAILACLLVAVSIGQLAKHLPSAGAFYTYASQGLHPSIGFLIAWAYAFIEPLVAPLLYLNLGFAAADFFSREPPHLSADLWWPWVVIGALLVFFLGYRGIQVSARTGTVLGIFEIGVFAILAIVLIAQADHNTLAVFTTKYANNPDFKGFSGVFAASVFTILAFIGFEAAAPLAEEARDPRKTIGRAVIYSCLFIGLYYVLTTYAATVYRGPTNMLDFPAGTGWENLARAVWGSWWVLIFLAIVNSTIANANAGSNAATRTWFAMGRVRILPGLLGTVHPRFRSPHIAVWAQLVVGLVVALWLGNQYDPITAFFLVATIITVLFVPIYIVINLSSLCYYWRKQRAEFNWFLHGVIPIVGIVVFVPAFLAGAGLKVPGLSFIAPLTRPLSYAGPVAGAWMLIGIVYLIVLYRKHPQRVADTGKVFVEEDVHTTAA
ncbi:MAG TPA: APC family permease [Actinomycetota bacterium]